jgi:hypothetical protein
MCLTSGGGGGGLADGGKGQAVFPAGVVALAAALSSASMPVLSVSTGVDEDAGALSSSDLKSGS